MWTEQEIQILKDNHGKLTLPMIQKMLNNKSYTCIRSRAQRMGLYRNKSLNPICTKYSFDTEYFKELNPIKCYLGGIICTDGCIMNTGKNKNIKYFSHKVSIKDEIIIDNLIKELKFTGNKKYVNHKSPNSNNICKCVYITLSCFNKNAEYLEKYFNIVPQKTHRLKGTNINDNFLNLCFCIGAFDGDGTVGYSNGSPYISIASVSKDFIVWMKNIIDLNFSEYKFRECKNGNIDFYKRDKMWRFTTKGVRAAIIINYLGQFPVPKLDRKWNNQNILKYIKEKKNEYKYKHFFKDIILFDI